MLKGENTDLIGRTGSYRTLCLINSICFFFLVVRMIRGTLQILGCCLNRRVLQCEKKEFFWLRRIHWRKGGCIYFVLINFHLFNTFFFLLIQEFMYIKKKNQQHSAECLLGTLPSILTSQISGQILAGKPKYIKILWDFVCLTSFEEETKLLSCGCSVHYWVL